ncbi:hypothetical protein Sj15T_01390 [Sphingobium sp. TA15]|nr:hypothetical protein Sj15T_01390 [Sphingobium sp. TA15]
MVADTPCAFFNVIASIAVPSASVPAGARLASAASAAVLAIIRPPPYDNVANTILFIRAFRMRFLPDAIDASSVEIYSYKIIRRNPVPAARLFDTSGEG